MIALFETRMSVYANARLRLCSALEHMWCTVFHDSVLDFIDLLLCSKVYICSVFRFSPTQLIPSPLAVV